MLKIVEKIKRVLEVFSDIGEELRIEEIQQRLREGGHEVPKTTLRTWLQMLGELGLIRINYEIEKSRGMRVVAKYRPRILIGKDLLVGIPKQEIEELKKKNGEEVIEYLLRRSGYST